MFNNIFIFSSLLSPYIFKKKKKKEYRHHIEENVHTVFRHFFNVRFFMITSPFRDHFDDQMIRKIYTFWIQKSLRRVQLINTNLLIALM